MISEFECPKGVSRFEAIQNVPAWPKIQYGIPQAGAFPEDAYFQMSPDFPKDIKVADVLRNVNQFLVVSERLLEFLSSQEALYKNETHPIAIKNHKGRTEKGKYFLVHQIGHPACVDESKTVGTKGKVASSQYLFVEKLVLDPPKIDKKLRIFRPAQFSDRPFFREDLAAKIEAEGFTGISFFDPETYDGY
jgi:hypothetical protein